MFFVLKNNKLIKRKIQTVKETTLNSKELLFITLIANKPMYVSEIEDVFDLYGMDLTWFVNKIQRKTDLYITRKNGKYYLETPISYIY